MGCAPSMHIDQEGEEEPMESIKRLPRPSVISLQIPKELSDDASSDAISERSMDMEHNEEKDIIYGTDISLQWLLQRMSDKLGKSITEEPQWICERLNRPSFEDYATSSVIRVTFGWDNSDFPRNIVLKVPITKEQREDSEGKFHYIMYKRECNVYDWTSKYSSLSAPYIFHIKRHSKECGSGIIVMEDVQDIANQQDAKKGINVDCARDLMRQLALLHAQSVKQNNWNNTISDLPPSYYTHIINDFNKTRKFFEAQDVEYTSWEIIKNYFSMEYLHNTATESCDLFEIEKVLVHGEPYASNIFTEQKENKQNQIYRIIDWTESHGGCFAEDLAKAICWNLSPKDRVDCKVSLLECYHYHLSKYSDGQIKWSIDIISKAFDHFLPFAMVTLCDKIMKVSTEEDTECLIERTKGLIQSIVIASKVTKME